MSRRWLVTGCSSGLGLALARAVAAGGDRIVATSRGASPLDALAARFPGRVVPARLELRSAADCAAAVELARERLGGVDVLVNNAGVGLFGAVEEVSDAELREQLEVLAVAPWRLARLVLPLMRAQGGGHVVNVSSVGGRMAFPGLGAYVAGKFALEGMSLALAAEAAPFGVRVTVVEPGGFATSYGNSLAETAVKLPEYGRTLEPMHRALRGMAGDAELNRPEAFAELVLRAVAAPAGPVRVPVGLDAYAMVEAALAGEAAELAAARALAEEGAVAQDGAVAPDPV
ncbi:SDR family oxidoreductase [Kitasatospora sp. NRRL B-11411]|uniref:SDR family oxidoreductase n=1 Tax=Kitasatospora sp. NRRL B-11411 TaxID=1463822 RepID=UPI00068FA400|nr:SDR family oxidoreductase [Kitasatospora sp. NRRL B-11411]